MLRIRLVALSILVLAAAGCAQTQRVRSFFSRKQVAEEPRVRLALELRDFVDRFAFRIHELLAPVQTRADDPATRRRALNWEILLVTHARGIVLQDDENAALVDLWVLVLQVEDSVREARPKDELAAVLGKARHVAKGMRRDIELIAKKVFAPEEFAKVQSRLAAFAREHPIYGKGGPRASEIKLEHPADMSWVAGLSSLPGKVLLDDTPQAIVDASKTVGRLTRVAQYLPERVRWEAQLLLYELEGLPTTRSLVSGVERASTGIAAIGSAAEALPASVRRTLEDGTRTLAPTLRTVRGTVGDVRAAVAAITTVVHDARSTSGRLALAGEAWGGAVKEVRGLIADATAEDPNAPRPTEPEPPARPFDIREYTATAAAITTAAHGLRGAVVEVRGLVTSSGEVRSLADHAADRAGGLIGRATWSLAFLIVLTFGAAFGYRWASWRFLSGAGDPPADAA